MKLQLLSLSLENIRLRNKIDTHKRFQLLLANEDIARVRSVMNVCLKSGAGLNTILNKFSMAAQNLYSPRAWEEKEVDLAVLVLKIGGPALLHTFNKLSLLPSSSFIYKVIRIIYKVFLVIFNF